MKSTILSNIFDFKIIFNENFEIVWKFTRIFGEKLAKNLEKLRNMPFCGTRGLIREFIKYLDEKSLKTAFIKYLDEKSLKPAFLEIYKNWDNFWLSEANLNKD